MSIPPVSAEDLAELVLGYLADEQLMTVYDEFLMASPHVDSHKNEYKRIWMKSLHSIVDEYWAIKIFVEKCKPISLRRKLIQCSNLLDIFKFLIANVDMKKVFPCATTSHNKISIQAPVSPNESNNNAETSKNTLEATSLADLPGNNHFPAKRKQVKVLDKDSPEAAMLIADVQDNHETVKQYSQPDNVSNNVTQLQNDFFTSTSSGETYTSTEISHSKQQLSTHQQPAGVIHNSDSATNTSSYVHKPSFQEFTTTCEGGPCNLNTSLPDSSTSENATNLPLARVNQSQQSGPSISPMYTNTASQILSNSQYLLQVSNTKNVTIVQSHSDSNNGKGDESKITILSDIKVDTNAKKDKGKPVVLQRSASPMLQLQTIVVNGTPAYKPKQIQTYTRDEIMAMPTLIVVSAPGPPPIANTVKTTAPSTKPDVTSSTSSITSLQPLIIDISDSPADKMPINMPSLNLPSTEPGLLTEVEVKNASVPKDSMITQGKSSTPQVLPLTRKASSTPRRSSHIRVLDFTTPRRILHENVNENPLEVIVSRSPNLQHLPDAPFIDGQVQTQAGKETGDDDTATKENKTVVPKKKSNWDADLRALAISSTELQTKPVSRARPKKKKSTDTNTETDKKSSRRKSPKKRSRKKKPPVEESIEELTKVTHDNVEVPVKPTINVITNWNNPVSEVEKRQISPVVEAQTEDTPEMNRLFLQNPISNKLNISDILETPFKQALYDIQMDTPKFLRPDIPISDEPVSEIKITDIPTPRFFDTPNYGYPKPSQATPSSYSSRPTDYSSGGSYYKPDEQDYIPRPEDLGSPIKTTAPEKPELKTIVEETKDPSTSRSSRPKRQCAKNVTYCDAKTKTSSKSSDVDNLTNESAVDNDSEASFGHSSKSEDIPKPDTKPRSKIDSRRKSNSSTSNHKKSKSPAKTTQKPFMKIKPRSTPKQDSKRKSSADSSKSRSQSRKRTLSKDKNSSTHTPVAAAPTKSRRKSSTPRKLHAKVITSSSESPEIGLSTVKSKETKDDKKRVSFHDSDAENLPLRWSDEGSQDVKNVQTSHAEDISQIKAYIEETITNKGNLGYSEHVSLHVDLVRRGFDIETARSIERDLLDTPPQCESNVSSSVKVSEKSKEIPASESRDINMLKEVLEKSVADASNNLDRIAEEEEDVDEIELSAYECNIDCENYITCVYDDTVGPPKTEPHKLKDNFTMEFCIEDDAIRLKTTAFTVLFDQEPDFEDDVAEAESAANCIPHFDRLYTPLKESIQAQCRDIFDSTLTSLDASIRADSPSRGETEISEIILEVEQIVEDIKDKSKKRKRTCGSGSEEVPECKRGKRESRLLPNIQNIDIESVLSKLHGP